MNLGFRAVLVTVAGLAAASAAPRPGFERAAMERLRPMAAAAGVVYPFKHVELKVYKEAHVLELQAEGKLLKRYAIALGHRGLADKRRSGDHLTPEGRYYLCSRNRASQFHLFMGISYPDEAAAARGLKQGLIRPSEAEAIRRAQRAKTLPPQFTGLGGLVGLHGGGTGSEWTWGCVALSNEDIEELWVACPIGTPIQILP